MELAGFIQIARTAPPLDFLIIGGFAVAAHGHTRATFDVDFLVRKTEREQWKSKLGSVGMQIEAESMAFIQFISADEQSPLDLMMVDDPTFSKFEAGAVEMDFGDVQALVPTEGFSGQRPLVRGAASRESGC